MKLIDKIERFYKLATLGVGLDGLDKFISSNDNPKYFFHMSDIERFGINPKSYFNTPFGVYGYPLTQDYYNILVSGRIPFGGERKYIHVFSLSDDTFNIAKYNSGMYEKDLKILSKMYGLSEKDIDKYEKSAYEQKYISYLMNITRELAGKDSKKWNVILRNLGYSNLYDNGGGIIHINEKEQIVVLDPSVLVHLDVFENKFGGTGKIKSDLGKLKKLIFESGKMSDDDIKQSLKQLSNEINIFEFFKNVDLNIGIIEFIYKHGGNEWHRSLASYNKTPDWILEKLIDAKDKYIDYGLAENVNIGNNIFNELVNSNDDMILKILFDKSSDDNRLGLILSKLKKLDIRHVHELVSKLAAVGGGININKLNFVFNSGMFDVNELRELKQEALYSAGIHDNVFINIVNGLVESEIDLVEIILDKKPNKNVVGVIVDKLNEFIGGNRKNYIKRLLADIYQKFGEL